MAHQDRPSAHKSMTRKGRMTMDSHIIVGVMGGGSASAPDEVIEKIKKLNE